MNKSLCFIVVILSAIGAINWGFVGVFNFDLVAALFGNMSILARIVYIIIGVCGLVVLFSSKCLLKCCDGKTMCGSSNKSNT